MSHKKKASELFFSVDLHEQCINHISFLKAVDDVDELKKPHVLKRALYRYEKYWLPLAAEHTDRHLVAPLDIEWVWHTHMLCPRAYKTDCETIVGLTVDHTLYNRKNFKLKQKDSQKLWAQKYSSDNEPFDIDFNIPYDLKEIENFQSKFTYDIVSAAQRQAVFYYQVSLPHYLDSKFLDSCLQRYKQFLYLKVNLPKEFLVPCYDIDLMWHSHQLNPLLYKRDTERIIGYLFNHDDSTNDRSEGSKLDVSDKRTRVHWKNFFNEMFSLFGAMYRGPPPAKVLTMVTPEETYTFSTKECTISLDKLTLTVPEDRYKKLKLHCSTSAGNVNVMRLFTLKRPQNTPKAATTLTWLNVGNCVFNTLSTNNIRFVLREQTGWGICASYTENGSNVLNMLPLIESRRSNGQIHAKISLDSETNLEVEGRFSPPSAGKVALFLDSGRYEKAIIPENIQTLWGPVNLERLPPGADNRCQVASHRLKNHLGNVEFTARTIHSQRLMMSVVQVFYHDKMSVIGHLIASDQLPLPTQVKRNLVTLNPRQGERAVLIKNHQGDWGVLLGRWGGFKRGQAGTRNKQGVKGSPGTLYLKFYKFSTGKLRTIQLGYLEKKYSFNLESASVDLKKGTMTIDSKSNEVAENITLAFSVSLLHVLCVPRPKGWQPGKQVKPSVTNRGTRAVTVIPSDDMAFVMAAGLLWSTPSNHYMHNTYGTNFCAMCGGFGDGGQTYDNWNDLEGGDADGGDGGCDGSACGGGGDGGDGGAGCGGGCGGCGGCGGGGCGGGGCGGGGCGGGCGGCGG